MRLRYSRATAALLFVATASTTSGLSSSDASSAGRTGRDLRGKPTPTGRLASTTTVPSDSNERTRRRKRKVAAAPLVDSTLLRFVSEQKKRQEAQLVRQPELPSTRKSVEALVNTQLMEQPQTTSSLPASESNRTVFLDGEAILDSMAASLRGQDHMDPWMGQYNRNRVAQKLISLGVDAENAMEAGEKIQSYLLTRTARRRIRIFLKERDSLWNKADEELATLQLQQLVENKVSRMTSLQPGYGFDDVVEVMLEFGLTGNDVCTILTHTPNIAIMMPRKSFVERSRRGGDVEGDDNSVGWSVTDTLEDTLDRSFNQLLQIDLGLRKYDARKVLRGCPGLLSVRGSQSAVQIVAMMTKLGVSKNSIARDKTALPLLLSRSPAAMFRLVSFLCSDKVRMPIKSIGPLLRRPASRELVDKLAPVPKLQQSPQLNDDESESIGPYEESASWGRHREERLKNINDLYRNMTATAQALRFEVGTKDLGKLISAYPSVLLLNAEEQILPTASYLVEELGIWEDGLPGVLQQYPMLLGKDIEEMKKVTSFLLYLGVKEEDLGRMFRAFPGLLTMDIEKEMTPVVDFLIEIGVSNIGSFVTTLPPVLGYSVEKELRPKWEYLQRVCLQPTFEINNFPGYFSYPFDRVIRTRYEYLAAKGIARQLVPVDAVVRFGDIDFATKIARDDDGGKVFRAFSEKRKLAATNGQQRRPRQNKANHPKAGP